MECNGRFKRRELLRRAPEWFCREIAEETGRDDLEGVGLPADHPSFSREQRAENHRQEARRAAETAQQRVRRIARAKRRK